MPQFFMNKRLVILLAGIIVLVALIGFSLRERDQLSWPEQFVKDTAGLAQMTFAKPAHLISDFVENIQDLQQTYEENKVLKERLDEYAQIKVKADRLEKENEELKALIGKEKDLASFAIHHASVIARDQDQWQETLTIDKGEVQGIKKDMAVVTADGMIGKIKSVGKITSTVQLLSNVDRTNRTHVAIQAEHNVYGLIEGYNTEKQQLIIQQIPAEEKIKKGMDVITSGLANVFPKGLYIGKVVKVEPDQYGLTQTAYVKPAANFYNIENVIVVEREMTTTEDSGNGS